MSVATREPFQPSRSDGRSDRQVVFELVKGAQPGELFTHEQLQDALAEGLDERPERTRVYPAVSQANRTLLREERRYLLPVRGTGYRVAHGSEHLGASMIRKDRAQHQLSAGLRILEQVRWDELDANQRALHEGHMRITAGLYGAIQVAARRTNQHDELIAGLTERVGRLEGEQQA